jgi:hypothetical protein
LLNTPAQKLIEIWLVWPVIINSTSNAVIYYCRSSEIRRAFKRLLGINQLSIFTTHSKSRTESNARPTIVGTGRNSVLLKTSNLLKHFYVTYYLISADGRLPTTFSSAVTLISGIKWLKNFKK